MKWLLLLLPFAIAALATAAVCGNGGGTEGTFVFTPVPYTYVTEAGTVVPESVPTGEVGGHCYPFVADEVDTLVSPDHLDDFRDWLTSVGFTVRRVFQISPTPYPAHVLVGVPPGSVPDAVALIRSRPGVVAADRNSIGRIPEAPIPAICPTDAAGPTP